MLNALPLASLFRMYRERGAVQRFHESLHGGGHPVPSGAARLPAGGDAESRARTHTGSDTGTDA